MKKKILAGLGSGVLFLGATGPVAFAAPISSSNDAALTGATIIRFEDITPGQYVSLTLENLTISTITYYEPDPTFTPKINVGNDVRQGKWVPPTDKYLYNLFAQGDDLYFDFAANVSAFGLQIGKTNAVQSLTAWDRAGNLIETVEVPDMTTWINPN
ncbi:MAG: hypothetical protein HY789_01075 [Deltaproteobacteria bacterium]|nr:hypothetical protein [Deltaproteobacteria bacterium]